MSLSAIRERMEREFAAVRAELRKIETAVEAARREAKGSRDARERLRRAHALVREIEWLGAGDAAGSRAKRHCPSCHGTEPKHAGGCELAGVLGDAAE
jgi:hypothetical protein